MVRVEQTEFVEYDEMTGEIARITTFGRDVDDLEDDDEDDCPCGAVDGEEHSRGCPAAR
jgi:hypothetical protein